MNNILFIEGGTYTDIKKALGQWLDASTDILTPGLFFELYKNGRGKHIVKADDKLENEQFNYLLNYLKYPEDIDYKIEVTGVTTIFEPTVFPIERIGEEILIFIPESDDEYDNVYWVTKDGQVFKTDFGGKTFESNVLKIHEEPEFNPDEFPPPENFYSKRVADNPIDTIGPEVNEEIIGKRFRVFSILIGALIFFSLLFYKNPSVFLDINKVIVFATLAWFVTDYTMLSTNKYFNLSFLFAIAIVSYGYLVRQSHPFYKFVGNLEWTLSIPLIFLIVQKPLRIGFKLIMKREPVLEKPLPSFVDFIYIALLFVSVILITQLIPRKVI